MSHTEQYFFLFVRQSNSSFDIFKIHFLQIKAKQRNICIIICSLHGFILGSPRTVRSKLDAGWRLEASQALYTFLKRLNQPLIPVSIQSLVLGKQYNIIRNTSL